MTGYEARYSIRDANGAERSVVFASEVDTKEEADARLNYEGGEMRYETYDVTSHHDKAILTLAHDGDCDLYAACIYYERYFADCLGDYYLGKMIQGAGSKEQGTSVAIYSIGE
jgi:hypothetical protein